MTVINHLLAQAMRAKMFEKLALALLQKDLYLRIEKVYMRKILDRSPLRGPIIDLCGPEVDWLINKILPMCAQDRVNTNDPVDLCCRLYQTLGLTILDPLVTPRVGVAYLSFSAVHNLHCQAVAYGKKLSPSTHRFIVSHCSELLPLFEPSIDRTCLREIAPSLLAAMDTSNSLHGPGGAIGLLETFLATTNQAKAGDSDAPVLSGGLQENPYA